MPQKSVPRDVPPGTFRGHSISIPALCLAGCINPCHVYNLLSKKVPSHTLETRTAIDLEWHGAKREAFSFFFSFSFKLSDLKHVYVQKEKNSSEKDK